MDNTEILSQIHRVTWFHAYEVLPGITTPGRVPVNAKSTLDRFKLPANLSGLKALDIGAWDGPYSFELERRGADVTALDIQDPSCTGFSTAKNLRNSNVKYVQASVYAAAKVLNARFDVILFLGVYYHLKHPILAFEQIHNLLKNDGILVTEGECLRNWAPTPKEAATAGNPAFWGTTRLKGETYGAVRMGKTLLLIRKCYRRIVRPRPSRFAKAMANSAVPITLFYSGQYKQDATNWFIPNLACIREWLAEAGLELSSFGFDDAIPIQRFWGIAKKSASSRIPIEHGLVSQGEVVDSEG